MNKGNISALLIGGVVMVVAVMGLQMIDDVAAPIYTIYEVAPDGFHWFFNIPLDLNESGIIDDGSIVCYDDFLLFLVEGLDFNIDYDADPNTFTANLAGQGDAHCNYTHAAANYKEEGDLMNLVPQYIPIVGGIALLAFVIKSF